MIEAIKWKPYEGETVIVKTILRKGKKIQKKKFYKDKVKAVPKGNAYIIGNGPSRKDFDLGKLKTWGTPQGYEYRHNFKKYLNAIWEKSFKPDLVLVDGRFRVACFLTSLLNADELRKIIMDSLNELGEETKTALTLREFDGLSYEQISEIIKCPVGTVRSRIFRGRELLDEAIRKYKEDNKPLLSKIKQ